MYYIGFSQSHSTRFCYRKPRVLEVGSRRHGRGSLNGASMMLIPKTNAAFAGESCTLAHPIKLQLLLGKTVTTRRSLSSDLSVDVF